MFFLLPGGDSMARTMSSECCYSSELGMQPSVASNEADVVEQW